MAVALTIAAPSNVAADESDSGPKDPVKALVGRLDLERYKVDHPGTDTVWRPPPGNRPQSRRRGLDREPSSRAMAAPTSRASNIHILPTDKPPAQRAGDTAQRATSQLAARAIAACARRPGVNTDPMRQPDAKLRALNSQASVPGAREEVYCTKVGTTHPEEMYIVGAHMDGHGWGEAANDDGSGTALVMELARVLSRARGQDRALDPLRAVEQRGDRAQRRVGLRGAARSAAGKGGPGGIGPLSGAGWLGMIQHDMMLFDHGMPRADGTMSPRNSGRRRT